VVSRPSHCHRWHDRDVIQLAQLVEDFAAAVRSVDGRSPQAIRSRTGRAYQPGIGPHSEDQTLRLVAGELAKSDVAYAQHSFGVSYPGASRRRCDWCLGTPPSWEWAIEVKMLRLFGDNQDS
jgi:hypothetical protein